MAQAPTYAKAVTNNLARRVVALEGALADTVAVLDDAAEDLEHFVGGDYPEHVTDDLRSRASSLRALLTQ